jgi:hypothetical protein
MRRQSLAHGTGKFNFGGESDVIESVEANVSPRGSRSGEVRGYATIVGKPGLRLETRCSLTPNPHPSLSRKRARVRKRTHLVPKIPSPIPMGEG